MAKTWSNLNVHRQRNKKDMVYVEKWNIYSATKKNEIMPFIVTWTDLGIITLSEVSQAEKDKYHVISLLCEI